MPNQLHFIVQGDKRYGNSCLHWAVINSQYEVVAFLVEQVHLFNIDQVNHSGNSPLTLAILAGDQAMVTYLVERGSRLNDSHPVVDSSGAIGVTPLQMAVSLGLASIASNLIKNGAFINHRDSQNESVLFIAVRENDLDMTRILLENGIDSKIRNCDGDDAWSLSEEFHQYDLLSLLKQQGHATQNMDRCSVQQTTTCDTASSSVREPTGVIYETIEYHIPSTCFAPSIKHPKERISRVNNGPFAKYCSSSVSNPPWNHLNPCYSLVKNLI